MGLDPRPFSNSEERTKLGELMKDLGTSPATKAAPPATKPKTKQVTKVYEVKISPSIERLSVNLGARSMDDGKEMARVYYTLWVFENSLRQFIMDIMEHNHGPNWWSSHVSTQTQNRASERRAKDRANRWHSTRGAHEIFYVDIGDYKGIMTKNWSIFEPVFSGLDHPPEWILSRIDEITLSRNIVAHMNPLQKDDIDRIGLYLRDWLRQIH